MQWTGCSRLGVALGLSVLAHAALIFGLVLRPPAPAAQLGPRSIEARLEPWAADRQLAALEQAAPAELPDAVPPAPPPELPPEPAAEIEASPGAGGDEREASILPEIESEAAIDDTWYPAKQLDVLPVALAEVEPRYPELASAQSVGGEVTLLLLVDEMGEVQERSVVEADPPGVFDGAALDAFRDVRFQPARKNGRNVRSRVLVTLSFNPEPLVREEALSAPEDQP